MPICTVVLGYEIHEGSLRPLGPLLSWTISVIGLRPPYRDGIRKFYPELKDAVGKTLSYSQNEGALESSLPAVMEVVTKYLNWLDGEGFKVAGCTMDSSVFPGGGVTKTQIYTLQLHQMV